MIFPLLLGLAFGCGIGVGIGLFLLVRAFVQRVSHTHVNASSPANSQPNRSVGQNLLHSAVCWSWLRRAGRIIAVIGGPVAMNGLYASFAIAQSVLHQVDPLVFTAVQMALLLPVAALLLFCSRRTWQRARIQQGLIAGGLLGIGFLCMALALRAIGIVPAAMLTALDGILASLLSWLVLRQRQPLYTGLAAACAGLGALLLWWVAPGCWQADLVALGCGLHFTIAALFIERSGVTRGPVRQLWPFLGALFAAMAGITLALALCFGSWSSLATMTSADLGILVYASVGAVLLPILLLTLLQRVLSAVTVAFLAVLEPLGSIGFASAFGTLALPFIGWWGVALILVSMLLQARAAAGAKVSTGEAHAVVREAAELVQEEGAVAAPVEVTSPG
jgi:drug/metabolite transporter (DMT)-like permease